MNPTRLRCRCRNCVGFVWLFKLLVSSQTAMASTARKRISSSARGRACRRKTLASLSKSILKRTQRRSRRSSHCRALLSERKDGRRSRRNSVHSHKDHTTVRGRRTGHSLPRDARKARREPCSRHVPRDSCPHAARWLPSLDLRQKSRLPERNAKR